MMFMHIALYKRIENSKLEYKFILYIISQKEYLFHTVGLFHNVFNLLHDMSRETSFRGQKLEDRYVLWQPRHRMHRSSWNKFLKFPSVSYAPIISSNLKLENFLNILAAICLSVDMVKSKMRPSILYGSWFDCKKNM